MSIGISAGDTVDWCAAQWAGSEYSKLSDTEKTCLKYNVTAAFLNSAMVLLVVSVATAIFSCSPTAIVLGAIALLVRYLAENEAQKYTTIKPEKVDLCGFVVWRFFATAETASTWGWLKSKFSM